MVVITVVKMSFAIIIFINFAACQFLNINISVPLSASRQYVDTHIGLFNQLSTNFQSKFNLDYNENPSNDTYMIVISQKDYITSNVVFNAEYRIKPLCSYNTLYLGNIYNCVTKGTYIYIYLIII